MNTGIANRPAEKDLGVLVDEKLDTELAMSTYSPECQSYIGLHQKKRSQKVYSTPVRPQLEYCFQIWSSQHKKGTNLLQWVQRRAMGIIRGMECFSYKDRLRELELFSQEKRRLQEDPIEA